MPTFNTRARLGRLWTSPFLRHNAVYFAGSMAIGLLNYLYYPVLGRLMPPGGFGEAQVLAVLLAQVTIFLNVFGLMTVNIVTNYRDPARRNQLILELERLALTLAGICLVAAALGGGWLQRFFHFDSAWPFIILMLAVLATVPLTTRSAASTSRSSAMPVARAGHIAESGTHTSKSGAVPSVIAAAVTALSSARIDTSGQSVRGPVRSATIDSSALATAGSAVMRSDAGRHSPPDVGCCADAPGNPPRTKMTPSTATRATTRTRMTPTRISERFFCCAARTAARVGAAPGGVDG